MLGFTTIRWISAKWRLMREFQRNLDCGFQGKCQNCAAQRRKSLARKHNIFGNKIHTGVAIGFFVRNPKRDGCDIHYLTLDDFLTAMEKRRWLAAHSLRQLARDGEFARVRPNERGDWINQPTADWSAFLPVADKAVKAGQSEGAIFRLHSLGISTNRDEWLYGLDAAEVERKVRYLIQRYGLGFDGCRSG
ncbi:MAG: type ISP restriction/modification enzyme [Candidatus Competibacter sp.]